RRAQGRQAAGRRQVELLRDIAAVLRPALRPRRHFDARRARRILRSRDDGQPRSPGAALEVLPPADADAVLEARIARLHRVLIRRPEVAAVAADRLVRSVDLAAKRAARIRPQPERLAHTLGELA